MQVDQTFIDFALAPPARLDQPAAQARQAVARCAVLAANFGALARARAVGAAPQCDASASGQSTISNGDDWG